MEIWDQMSINVGHQFIWRQIYVEQQKDKKRQILKVTGLKWIFRNFKVLHHSKANSMLMKNQDTTRC